MTPLVRSDHANVWLKADFLFPTLSFKDRGAAVLLAVAKAAGVPKLIADSSGNAGAAIAAYAARAGIDAEVFVPARTSAGKVAAIARFGAAVRVVDGSREDAARAARARVEETGRFYASHVYQPLFFEGTKTWAFEVWEQLGRRAPEIVVLPCGNGTLVLGVARGFAHLVACGLIPAPPQIVAVQARRCAPLAGLSPSGATVAEGIAIASPARGSQVLDAVAGSGGQMVTVTERAIEEARRDLARQGLDVEPTAAVTWAAWNAPRRVWGPGRDGPVVVAVGGAGLKAWHG